MIDKMYVESYFVPVPHLKELRYGEEFWAYSIDGVHRYTWVGSPGDKLFLGHGYCFKTFEDASEAFISATNATKMSMNLAHSNANKENANG